MLQDVFRLCTFFARFSTLTGFHFCCCAWLRKFENEKNDGFVLFTQHSLRCWPSHCMFFAELLAFFFLHFAPMYYHHQEFMDCVLYIVSQPRLGGVKNTLGIFSIVCFWHPLCHCLSGLIPRSECFGICSKRGTPPPS